jgi:hypothetical protein
MALDGQPQDPEQTQRPAAVSRQQGPETEFGVSAESAPDMWIPVQPDSPDEPPTRGWTAWGSGRRLYAVLAGVLVILLLGAFVYVWPQVRGKPAAVIAQAPTAGQGEIFQEPADTPGPDPFTPSAVVPPIPPVAPPLAAANPAVADAGAEGTPSVRGSRPTFYGAVKNAPGYNKTQLVNAISSQPSMATAWAGALGTPPSGINGYISRMTPMQLRADIRVTLYLWRSGKAVPVQAVLQVGTVVLVDNFGRPRARPASGSPLRDPIPVPTKPVYTGISWPGFNPAQVDVVAQATQPMNFFVLYDLITGQIFMRPVGTFGPQDYILVAVTPQPPVVHRPVPHHVTQPDPPPVEETPHKHKHHKHKKKEEEDRDNRHEDKGYHPSPDYHPPTHELDDQPS